MSGQSSGSSAPFAIGEQPNVNGPNSTRDQALKELGVEVLVREELDHDGYPRRRHKPRSSGGFLLQKIAAPMEPDNIQDVKGKRKAEEGGLVVPKRASARQRHRQKPSLGGSPLATEVVSVHSSEHTDDNGALERDKRSSVQSKTGQGVPGSRNIKGTSAGSVTTMDSALPPHGGSVIGHGTDAAQIVNLALNLSESRRRNFSSGGLLVPRDGIGTRRIISSGQQTLALPNITSGGSLRQHLQHQNRVSRNMSPRSGRSGGSSGHNETGSDAPQLQKELVEKRHPTLLPDYDATVADSFAFEASDATYSRAEKARLAIEIMYEYRRLLQYLPPIPIDSKRKPVTSKDGAKYQAESATELGRIYNPLQYIRNRKVRFRERRPLDPEAAGWKDLDRVRTWVDIVASEREDGISRVDRRFPLPSLDTARGEYPLADDLQNVSVPNSAASKNRKVERPRMDWEFAAWDLLADAYWLDEGDNLKHIEDHWGRKVIADHPSSKAYSSRASTESIRSSVRRSGSIVREHASPDRVRVLAGHSRKDSKERGRRSLDAHEPRSPVSEDNGSRDRKPRWSKKLIRSRSSSDSNDSHYESRRKQKRGRGFAGRHEDIESAALEKQMMDILAKEAEVIRATDQGLKEDRGTKVDPGARLDVSAIRDRPVQRDAKRPNAPRRMKTDVPVTTKHPIAGIARIDEERFQHRRMSSDDLDLTAPNSPRTPSFVPSITINLSPPASPPSAIPSPEKTLTSQIGDSHRDRSRSIDRRAIDEIDLDSSGTTDLSRQTTNQSQFVSMLRKEKSTALSNGSSNPVKGEAASSKHRSLDGSSIRNTKSAGGSDSRRRGLFKGGRIAELVGSEVSRVGDIFWRRDNNQTSRVESPASSYATSEESDLDDGDMSTLDNSPRNNLSRVTTKDDGSLSRVSTNSEKPTYYMRNLPSFRSSINRDEHVPRSSKASPYYDHIDRQQLAQRERGRSSRFERLAPPRIDMMGISAPSSREPSAVRSQSGRTNDEGSRHSSSSRSDQGVRNADIRLNEMLGIPGKAGTGLAPPTGLAGLESNPRESFQLPDLEEGKRQWSISNRHISTVHGAMNKRDIARVRALLLSSGVKANEIARRAEEVPEKPAPFLQGLEYMFKGPFSDITRSKEPLFAARILINNVETNIQKLRDDAEYFANATTKNLHDHIKAIDEHVTFKLTPLVRASADDADSFSTELTTTHTLAIKQLNDSINVILRRRRRRLRYVRRVGWAMVEWTLLGIMWMVWLIVVIIRLVRGTVGGLVKGLRWLFWL